jgi:hypothetical protein
VGRSSSSEERACYHETSVTRVFGGQVAAAGSSRSRARPADERRQDGIPRRQALQRGFTRARQRRSPLLLPLYFGVGRPRSQDRGAVARAAAQVKDSTYRVDLDSGDQVPARLTSLLAESKIPGGFPRGRGPGRVVSQVLSGLVSFPYLGVRELGSLTLAAGQLTVRRRTAVPTAVRSDRRSRFRPVRLDDPGRLGVHHLKADVLEHFLVGAGEVGTMHGPDVDEPELVPHSGGRGRRIPPDSPV